MKTVTVKCQECKNEFEKRKAEFTRSEKKGMKHFCSPSCSTTHRNKNLPVEEYRKHCYNIAQHAGCRQDEHSCFRYFINKSKSRNRYDTPNINVQYLKELWEKQTGICPYTKLKMILPKNTMAYHSKESCSLKRASLDRIDSSKGYIKGNVEFVCYAINLAKNSFTRDEMKEFLKEVVEPIGVEPMS